MSSKAISSLVKYFLISVLILLIYFSFGVKSVQAKSDDFVVNNFNYGGNLNLKAGNVTDALREFTKAEAIEPDNPDTLIGLVRCYSSQGEFDLAREKLTRFEELNPLDMRAHLVKAEYLAIKGHNEESADEFIILIEKGVYRFEALQGLIYLYAETGDERLKPVIDRTIVLYEPENRIMLYNILDKSLIDNGREEQARDYRVIADSLKENLDSGEIRIDSMLSELDQIVYNAKQLIDNGFYREAEKILAVASIKYQGETRIQELLKTCYIGISNENPVPGSVSGKKSSGLNSMLPTTKPTSANLSAVIPPNSNFPIETDTYITSMLNITSKTEDYFQQMLVSFAKLQDRIMEDKLKGDNSYQSAGKHVEELKVLLAESSKVCRMEIEALESLTPPPSFVEFHRYIIDTTDMLDMSFLLIDSFVTNQDWSSYAKVIGMLDVIDARMNNVGKIFLKAVNTELENQKAFGITN